MKKTLAMLLALVMVFALCACGAAPAAAPAEEAKTEAPAEEAKTEAPAEEDDGVIDVGVSLFYRRDEYYVDLESTFKTYGAEKGYNMHITDADADATTQIGQVEDFITQGVDVILLSACDPTALIDPAQKAIDAGIPVICYDGTIDSDICATKVIFDFYEDGTIVGDWAAKYIEENLGGEAKVAVLDFPASPIVCGLRAQGFVDAVSKLEGVEIVAQQDGKASRADSMTVMENILTANPDVDLVYGINYDTGKGAAEAIVAANSDAIVCCNAWGQEGFLELEGGDSVIKCMAASSPVTQAIDAIDAIEPALKGEELPLETLSHSTLLTSENIKDFEWRAIVEARVS